MSVTKSKAWIDLLTHYNEDMKDCTISELFEDEKRFEALSFCFDQLSVDFSKQKISDKSIALLIELAKQSELTSAIEGLCSGDKLNTTENRAALHSALRLAPNDELIINGENINVEVQLQLSRMARIIDDITLGNWRGYSGKPISDIVNLGVGGSDLGPLLVCEALDEFKATHKNPVKVHFVSTMDGSQVSTLFESLNPETTVFVIVSKSFTTIDTLSNAATAKAWLLSYFDDEKIINKQHFIGISTSVSQMTKWGINKAHQLKLWDWVGGRFSLWSTVGLTIALKIGMYNFREFLKGANSLDKHFSDAKFEENIPVLLGLIGVWNANVLKINAQAILPYDARLKYFPSYLTQLEMESNGKSVTRDGFQVDYKTCPVLWGEVGPNAQHAFYQLLHQGTSKVSCDFIAPLKRFTNTENNHDKFLYEQHLLTLANCFAQSRALMLGSSGAFDDMVKDGISPHKFYPGDQPSSTILLKELTPYSLGQLIALYEHKVFVMATIWRINPFDQWGVELGKTMAMDTLSELKSGAETKRFDCSTNALLNLVKSLTD